MTSSRLCQTWGSTSSVSALRVFLGSKQPPNRVLIALHSASRDVRRTVADSFSLQQTLDDNSIKSSYNKPKLASAVSPEDTILQAVRNGHLDTAVERLKKLRSVGSDVVDYSVEQLIEALLKKHRFQTAMSVFKLSQQSPILQMHYFTYQSLISAATKAGEPVTAVDIFRKLQAAGLNPNFITYSGLISALGKVRRKGQPAAELAYQLWQELFQSQLQLDAGAFRVGMNACIQVGKLTEARQLVQDMQQQKIPVDIRVFNILLKGYRRKGEVSAIPGVMQELAKAGLTPCPFTYNTLIDTYVSAGQLTQARQTCAQATAAGVGLDVWSYSSLIKGFVQSGELQSALEVLQEMKGSKGVTPNEVTYSTLIDGCVRQGSLGTAKALLGEMIAAGVRPNAVIYNTLLRAVVKDDEADMAGSTTLPKPGRLGATATSGERVVIRAPRNSPLYNFLQRAKPPSKICSEGAFNMLLEMDKAGVRPTVDTFNTLMDAASRRSDPQAVVRVFQQMEQSGCTPDAVSYTTLISAYCRVGRSSAALKAFQDLDANPHVKADLCALNAIIGALSGAGRMEEAEGYLARAAQLADAQEMVPPVEAFGAVINGYARLNQAEAALDVMREFWQCGGDPDERMFEVLVTLCVRTGEFRKALQVVNAMDKLGRTADKMRIKKVLEEFYRRQEKLKRQKPAAVRPVNEHLERFKFWLGLPNHYYEDNWR